MPKTHEFCKQCGKGRPRYRVTHNQSGPTIKFSLNTGLYCQPCSELRLERSKERAAVRQQERTAYLNMWIEAATAWEAHLESNPTTFLNNRMADVAFETWAHANGYPNISRKRMWWAPRGR